MAQAVVSIQSDDESRVSPPCPVCGSPMVRRTARKGANAGRSFWGCSSYAIDECPGTIDIPLVGETKSGPGQFAQAQFELRRRDHQRKMRALLPLTVAVSCLLSYSIFLAGVPYLGNWAGIPSLFLCLITILLLRRLPPEVLVWDKGARGERRTAEVLDPLQSRGFVVLYGRLMPDGRGDIDSIAIGPTGVWVIETKNLSGAVEVVNDRLFVKDHDRQLMVAQVYREAFAVQQIVGDLLAPLNTMVAPVLCIQGTRTPMFDHSVGGVRIASGRGLARLVTSGPEKLNPDEVQKIAAIADRKLREPSWAEEQ